MKHTVPHRLGTVDDAVDTRAALVAAADAAASRLRRAAAKYVAAVAESHACAAARPCDLEAVREAGVTMLAFDTTLQGAARDYAFAVDAIATLARCGR